MIKAFDLKRGRVIVWEGDLWTVESIEMVAKGNWRSSMAVRLKSLRTGRGTETRFSTDDKLETPFVDTKEYEYLYREGDEFVLMDHVDYEQIRVGADVMKDAHLYLKGNEMVTVQTIDGKIVSVELPNTVELKVTDTAPVVRSATATNQTKDATLETGLTVKVPPFIENGEMLRIDTRSGAYIERAK